MAKFMVRFEPSRRSARVAEGSSLLSAAAEAELLLQAPCGGQGRCGKCAVRVDSGQVEVGAAERRLFSEGELQEGWRLACQARVERDLEVFVPPSALITAHRIEVEGIGREVLVEPNVRKVALRLPTPSTEDPRDDLSRVMDALGKDVQLPTSLPLLRQLPGLVRDAGYQVTAVTADDLLCDVEPGDTEEASYGAAVDIGTTTVVLYLCHLPSGKVVAIASDLNPQAAYGEDVISRLQMASSEKEGLERLHGAITHAVDGLLGRAADEAGVARDRIYEIAVVGNTCMIHLFLGLSPVGLVRLPFVPAARAAQIARAADLGIRMHREGRVYVVPIIGGYVGADTVGVILASELDQRDGLNVAIDIGTNGEIVVAEDGDLYACSTAAGPAFEGARISQGMRASPGAIDRLRVGEDVSYHVIGEVGAVGLCGSGLLDAVAELAKAGVVDERGRLLGPEELDSVPEKVRRRVVQNDSGVEFLLASAQESGTKRRVAVTARDIRETQLAKGAIYAGVELLLDRLGRRPEEIGQLLLAGAFGNYVRRESAIAIGLVPALPVERVVSVGNAAGLGARLALCSVSLRRRAEEIARRVHHVELSDQQGFYDRFADAMAFRPLPRPR